MTLDINGSLFHCLWNDSVYIPWNLLQEVGPQIVQGYLWTPFQALHGNQSNRQEHLLPPGRHHGWTMPHNWQQQPHTVPWCGVAKDTAGTCLRPQLAKTYFVLKVPYMEITIENLKIMYKQRYWTLCCYNELNWTLPLPDIKIFDSLCQSIPLMTKVPTSRKVILMNTGLVT